MTRIIFSGILCLACAIPAKPQAVQPAPVVQVARDPQAVAVLQNAITALGGADAIAKVGAVVAQGSLGPIVGVSTGPSGMLTSEDQFTPQGHEFRDSFQSATVTQNIVSGHGSPGLVSNGKVRKFTPHVAQYRVALHLPATLLAGFLANTNCGIEGGQQVTFNGQPSIEVRVHVDTDVLQRTLSVQRWLFDATTGLPLRVEYRIPDTQMATHFSKDAADFSDFRAVEGVLYPFRIVMYQGGSPQNILALSSITVNPPVSPADFDLPTGGAQ